MREILFRGKTVDNGEWIYGDYSAPFAFYPANIFKQDGEYEGVAVVPETVGQYTGLTDKNGMRIFEGDLIRSTETGETAIVQWFSEHSAFMIWCKTSNQVGFLYECEKSIIEVIGNIHDNPELIGGEKN